MNIFTKIKDVDVSEVVAQIDAHPELWDQFNVRKTAPGTPHSQMSDIWVRYNDIKPYRESGDFSGFNDEHDPIWYPAWEKLPALKEIVFPLMSEVEGVRLGGVLITKIPSGCEIKPHVDRGWHVEYYDKFYVSLRSEPGANFYCGSEVLNPKVGEIWRFDNRECHWVVNDSPGDRMTLIVCIRTDKFVEH